MKRDLIWWGLVLVLLLVVISAADARAECKPTIPDDLRPTCRGGQLAVVSYAAVEAMVWPLPCPFPWISPEQPQQPAEQKRPAVKRTGWVSELARDLDDMQSVVAPR